MTDDRGQTTEDRKRPRRYETRAAGLGVPIGAKQSQFTGGGGVWVCVGRASSFVYLSRAGTHDLRTSPERRSLAFTGARAYLQWLVWAQSELMDYRLAVPSGRVR